MSITRRTISDEEKGEDHGCSVDQSRQLLQQSAPSLVQCSSHAVPSPCLSPFEDFQLSLCSREAHTSASIRLPRPVHLVNCLARTLIILL